MLTEKEIDERADYTAQEYFRGTPGKDATYAAEKYRIGFRDGALWMQSNLEEELQLLKGELESEERWSDQYFKKSEKLEEENKRLREALGLSAAVSRAFGFRLSHDDENPPLAEFHEDGMLNGDKFANYLDALKGVE